MALPQRRRPEILPAAVDITPPADRKAIAASHFRRLVGVVERGREKLGAIAISHESAATQIEAAEHAYNRLLLEIAGLIAPPRAPNVPARRSALLVD